MKTQVKKRSGTKRSRAETRDPLKFERLPALGDFILRRHLRDFVSEQIRQMFAVDFPVLRHTDFSGLSHDELIDLSIPSHRDFLRHVADNTIAEHLKSSISKWKADKLPVISKEQLAAEDISLSLYIRKKVFLHFARLYTSDVDVLCGLVNEIDRYVLEAENLSFNTFLEIHNSQRRRMTRQLERRTNQLLEAQELANLGSFEWDLTGRTLPSFSPQVYRIFETQELGDPETILFSIHQGDREKVRNAVVAALKGKREFECEYRYLVNGRTKVIWSRGMVEQKNDVPLRLRGTVMDITARQTILRKLKRNEELYKQAEKIARLGNWTYHLRTGEVAWSDELYRICEMTPQSREVTVPFFMDIIHPEDREMIRRQLRRILTDLQLDYHLRIVVPGGETKYLLGKAEIVNDPVGRPYKIIGTCQDISREVHMTHELRRREENLARLNESLEQKNLELQRKNEELTSFNYVASHDLQEPLRKIKTFSDLVLTREKSRLSETGVGWLQRISAAAGRLQALIQDLLSFSRTQLFDDSRKDVDLDSILATIRANYETDISNGQLTMECERLPVIKGVPFQVQQLFENLVANSVKYHREGTPARIRVSAAEAEVVASADHPEVRYLKISVSDNGIGFEQKYASKIFEIFQRLHGQLSYSGTGIGLAICKKIAENHSGFIRATGKPGEGAVFDVYLPWSLVVDEKKSRSQ